MSFRFNRQFHPIQSLSRFSNDLQLHWDAFKARYEESAQAVIAAAKDEMVVPLLDPTYKVREINRVQQAQVAVLYLADLFGADYVDSQIKSRAQALTLAAHDATFIAGKWLEGEVDQFKVFAEHIKQLAARAAELEGSKIDTAEYLAAYARHAASIVHEAGLTDDDDLATLLDYVLSDNIDYTATVADASAVYEQTTDAQTGGETHEEDGQTITNGVPDPDRSHIGDDLLHADTSAGAEQPASEDEAVASNEDIDTAPAGGDALDVIEQAEESRDEDEASSQ